VGDFRVEELQRHAHDSGSTCGPDGAVWLKRRGHHSDVEFGAGVNVLVVVRS